MKSSAGVSLLTRDGSSQSLWLAGVLSVLAVLGQWCSLRLIDVRPYADFQHYRSWRWLVTNAPPEAWVLIVQTVFVGVLCWRYRAEIRSWLGGRPVRLLLAAGVLAFSAAIPTESAWRFAGEVALAGGVALVSVLTLIFAVRSVPDPTMERLSLFVATRVTLAPGNDEPKPWDRRLPIAVAAWVAVAAGLASVFVFERVPHIDDSVSNFFQAKYLAAGRLFLPEPPDVAAFQQPQTIIMAGRWFGYAFPIWPMVLALGVLGGVPWLVNPILGGVLILAAHALTIRRHDRATANVVVLLLALSPWLLFMSAEFMVHPLAAVIAVMACYTLDRSATGPKWVLWSLCCGAAIGLMSVTRILDGAIVGAALAVTVVLDRRGRTAWRALALAGVVAAAVSSSMLPYNRALTGRATYPPHLAWSDSRWGAGVDRLGFGADVGIRAWPNLDPLPGHGPADVVLNANKNAFMVNSDLFGWAPGSVMLMIAAILFSRWHRRDGLILAMIGAYAVGYSFYWFSGGPDLGARYWYPLLVPFGMLSARALQMLTAQMSAPAAARAGLLVAIACLSAALTFMPWRATEKYYRYRGVGAQVRELQSGRQFDRALVFVRSPDREDYASAFVLNPRTLEGDDTVYAFDAGPESRARVVAHYPHRPVWVIGRVQDAAGSRLEVISGPLPPGTVPR